MSVGQGARVASRSHCNIQRHAQLDDDVRRQFWRPETPTSSVTRQRVEFLAWVLVHIPEKGHVTTRHRGWYANRPRGMREKAKPAAARRPPTNARRRVCLS